MKSQVSWLLSLCKLFKINTLQVGPSRAFHAIMMLKVRTVTDLGSTVFMLSGRIEERHLQDLRELLQQNAHAEKKVALDLEEVRLVDRDGIVFLAESEAAGIELRNCPPYVRSWIDTGRDTSHES